jgi:hypothetical protein
MPCLNLRPKENMKETFNTGQYTNKKELLEKILNSRSLLPEEKKLTKNVFYKDFIHENIVESIMSYFLDMDAYAQNYYKNRQWFGQVTYMLNVVLNHNWTIQNKWKEGWLITNTDQHHKIVYSLGDVTKECPSENNDLIVCTNVLPWLDNSTKGNYYSAKKIIFGSLAKEGLYLDEHGFSHRSQLITKF